ncbi:hypothetical protein SH668x_000295 [Planctomicrobium sp. SH668]
MLNPCPVAFYHSSGAQGKGVAERCCQHEYSVEYQDEHGDCVIKA